MRYDLTNNRYGDLIVLGLDLTPRKSRKRYWICRCKCGNKTSVTTNRLVSGECTRCANCAHKQSGEKRRKCLIGQRFGHLTVIDEEYGVQCGNRKRTICTCICDCGNIVKRVKDTLNSNKICSCGCARKEIADHYMAMDVEGKKINKLTVIHEYKELTPRKVLCRCDCGNSTIILKSEFLSGGTKSCGCLFNEKSRYSYGERLISDFLYDNHIKFVHEFSFPDLKHINRLRFDFVIFNAIGDIVHIIEYNGKQHYVPIDFYGGDEKFKEIQENDKKKIDYCKQNNYPLTIYKYDMSDNEIIKDLSNIIYP